MTKSGLISECSCAYEDSSTGSLSFTDINPVACRHKRLVLQCLSISNKATAGTVCICDDVPGCTFSHSTSNSSYSLWPWKKTLFVQLFCFIIQMLCLARGRGRCYVALLWLLKTQIEVAFWLLCLCQFFFVSLRVVHRKKYNIIM